MQLDCVFYCFNANYPQPTASTNFIDSAIHIPGLEIPFSYADIAKFIQYLCADLAIICIDSVDRMLPLGWLIYGK
jgi:hypothetical protein